MAALGTVGPPRQLLPAVLNAMARVCLADGMSAGGFALNALLAAVMTRLQVGVEDFVADEFAALCLALEKQMKAVAARFTRALDSVPRLGAAARSEN